jgi:hypothetical protein
MMSCTSCRYFGSPRVVIFPYVPRQISTVTAEAASPSLVAHHSFQSLARNAHFLMVQNSPTGGLRRAMSTIRAQVLDRIPSAQNTVGCVSATLGLSDLVLGLIALSPATRAGWPRVLRRRNLRFLPFMFCGSHADHAPARERLPRNFEPLSALGCSILTDLAYPPHTNRRSGDLGIGFQKRDKATGQQILM